MCAEINSGEHPGVPTEFYCEHSASKSRVLALVKRSGYVPSLHAVLSCTDRTLAHRIAGILNQAAESGRGPTVLAEATRMARQLPDAPAASFRHALEQTFALSWPDPDAGSITWDELHDSYGYAQTDDDPITPAGRDSVWRTSSAVDATALTGNVVRVVRTLDICIYDPDRFLANARADGWYPEPDMAAESSQDDLLGAAMWLADEEPWLPGADIVDHSARGEDLPGPQSSEARAHDRTDDLESMRPDFVSLFPVDDGEDPDWQLTPCTADALHTALSLLADEAYDDIEEHGDRPVEQHAGDWNVFDRLPRLSWRQEVQWRRQFARAADDLREDLEMGRWPIPRCNAEELCLHLAIEDAEGTVDEADQRLPQHADDYDWDMCSEVLFQDHDILLLDEAWADGIEDPDSDANRTAGIGDLRPQAWFQFFNNVDPRDQDRGFRR